MSVHSYFTFNKILFVSMLLFVALLSLDTEVKSEVSHSSLSKRCSYSFLLILLSNYMNSKKTATVTNSFHFPVCPEFAGSDCSGNCVTCTTVYTTENVATLYVVSLP